jgi:glycosyltransferase involved in cell wall biosynthesis
MRDLKVIHLQYETYETSFGNRLHKAFLKAGVGSHILSLFSEMKGSERVTSLGKKGKYIAKITTAMEAYLTRSSKKEYGNFSYPIFGSDISTIDHVQEADVIYIHWVLNGFLSFNSMEKLFKLGKPIIFFLHDMWTFTGGCHYSFTCEKYKTECNNCPFFPEDKVKDLAYKEFYKKQKLFNKYDNLHFVSPSKWLFNCSNKSALTKNKPTFLIPNYLDDQMFKPFDKKIAKKIMNIDRDKTVIAFGAVYVDSPYKGWNYLQQALELLEKDEKYNNFHILIFGSGYNKDIAERIPFKTTFAGFLSSDYALNLMYNAADVFVAPSLADNLPYTVLESLSCGTPVVAFKTGGIPDLIKHKGNGYLADYKNSQDLAKGIKYCIDNNVKGYVLPEFEGDLTIGKHLDLIEKILN